MPANTATLPSFGEGGQVTHQVVFLLNGTPTDPATVTWRYRLPGSSTNVVKVYGTDAEVQRNGVGTFQVSLQLTTDGKYVSRLEASGSFAAAAERVFVATPSQIV